MTITRERLAELRELLAGTTAGAWAANYDLAYDEWDVICGLVDLANMNVVPGPRDRRETDALFIAAAHNDMAALLDLAEAGMRYGDLLREAHDKLAVGFVSEGIQRTWCELCESGWACDAPAEHKPDCLIARAALSTPAKEDGQ